MRYIEREKFKVHIAFQPQFAPTLTGNRESLSHADITVLNLFAVFLAKNSFIKQSELWIGEIAEQ